MDTTIPTLRLRSSEALARDLGGSAGRVTLALDQDATDRQSIQTAINGAVWLYQLLLAAGADRLDVLDQLNGLRDIASNRDGQMRDALDELGLYRDQTIDLSGLDALRARLDAETSTRARMVRR